MTSRLTGPQFRSQHKVLKLKNEGTKAAVRKIVRSRLMSRTSMSTEYYHHLALLLPRRG